MELPANRLQIIPFFNQELSPFVHGGKKDEKGGSS